MPSGCSKRNVTVFEFLSILFGIRCPPGFLGIFENLYSQSDAVKSIVKSIVFLSICDRTMIAKKQGLFVLKLLSLPLTVSDSVVCLSKQRYDLDN